MEKFREHLEQLVERSNEFFENEFEEVCTLLKPDTTLIRSYIKAHIMNEVHRVYTYWYHQLEQLKDISDVDFENKNVKKEVYETV